MIVYPFFSPWKTRRAFLRGLLLGGAIFGACYGLEQQLDPTAWPAWLEHGDWTRCTVAGLLAFPLGVIEYGPPSQGRAPLHLVAFLFLAALVSLLAILLAPSFGAFTELLRTSTPEAAFRSLLPVLWPAGFCAATTALVFAAIGRERWRGKGLGGQLKAAAIVGLIGSGAGPLVMSLSGASEITSFVALLCVPLPFALLVPILGASIDKVDGWIFPLDQLAHEDVAPIPSAAPQSDDSRERIVTAENLEESSEARAFSWGGGGEDIEDEEPEVNPGERILGPNDDDSSGLDGLASRIFNE